MKRRMKALQAKFGSVPTIMGIPIEWNVKTLGYSVRCRVCKEFSNKKDYAHLRNRICNLCQASYREWTRVLETNPRKRLEQIRKELKYASRVRYHKHKKTLVESIRE